MVFFGRTFQSKQNPVPKSSEKIWYLTPAITALSIAIMLQIAVLPSMLVDSAEAATKSKKAVPTKRPTVTAPIASGSLGQGIAHYNKGLIAQAIPYFESAVKQSPNNEQAAVWLARAYQKQGLQEKAKHAYARVLSISPNNTEALATLGELYTWDLSTRAEGVTMLQRAYDQNGEPAVGKKLAEALLWLNRSDEAYSIAQPIADQFTRDKKWMNSYADILTRSGHADEAVSLYEGPLHITESRDLTQLQAYATALFKSGQTARAEQVYQTIKPYALNLGPTQGVEVKKSLAALAFDLGLYNEAAEMDNSLPEPQKSDKETRLRVARAYMRGGRTPEAVDELYRLYRQGQLTSSEKVEFADLLQNENISGPALPEANLPDNLFKQAISEDPRNTDAALRLAQRYRFSEDPSAFNQADVSYQQAWQLASQYKPEQAETVLKEYLEFLKTNKSNPAEAEQRLKRLNQMMPNDPEIKGAYAEFLSYQENRRIEALRLYIDLAKSNPEARDEWRSEIDKVLGWHKATTELIPMYQEIVNIYPNDKAIWLSVGKAYSTNPDYYPEALDLYTRMLQKFPNDPGIRKAWIDLLMGNPKYRNEAIAKLEQYSQQVPGDLDAKVALGKLYSYKRQYGPSMDILDGVLTQDPDHKDAAVARSYTLMWSGKKLQAKKYLLEVWQKYPDDVDVGLALAQANKFLGRYDEAFDIMRRIRPQLQEEIPSPKANKSKSDASSADFIPCAYEKELPGSIDFGTVVWDTAVIPQSLENKIAFAPVPEMDNSDTSESDMAPLVPTYSPPRPQYQPYQAPANVTRRPQSSQTVQTGDQGVVYYNLNSTRYQQPVQNVRKAPTYQTPTYNAYATDEAASENTPQSSEHAALQSDIDSLDAAIESLNALQASSTRQLNQLQNSITASKDKITTQISVTDQNSDNTASGALKEQMEEYAIFSSIGYDTNPLLSGLGRFKNDDLARMEKGLHNDLRPMLRAGYSFDTKTGEPTTSRLRSWGFPNQLAFSLSPQVRARFGVNPYKYYIPGPGHKSRYPRDTWSQEYTWGLTAKLSDKFTFDGDMALTHFNQSDSLSITYDASLTYDANDAWRFRVGSRRVPQFNSLLAAAGLRPNQGNWANGLVGQSRETGVYGEINWNPTANWDVNLGYEWAFVDGYQTPDNYKNQAFLSPGYTWHFADNHKVRLGLESLFMNYSKNTNVGYFDTTSNGSRVPMASLNPAAISASGYDFGGYFSPKWFFQNAGRVDFRGSFFDHFLEYKAGGSMGIQTFGEGHGITPGTKVSLTAAADLNLIANITDWFALYGFGEYLKAGSVFTRWRFGGGVILRPSIDAVSPIFRKDGSNRNLPASSNAAH